MKKIYLFLLALGWSISLSAQQFTDAVKYNDYIVGLQNEIGKKMITFNEQISLETSTYDGVMPYYNDLLSTTKSCIAKMEKLDVFEKNSDLKNAATELMKFYEQTISQGYLEMIDLLFKSTLDEAALARMNTILQEITNAESVIDNKFQTAQGAFAKKYGFQLTENELQQQLNESE